MSDVSFTWNMPYDAFLADAREMISAHWAEVGSHRDVLHLDPDHDRYRALQRSGVLHILTASSGGALAGYLFVLIAPHPRDRQATVAKDDIFYVRPEFRRERVGVKLLIEALRYLEGRAHIVFFTEKARREGGGYLERFGFEPQETTYGKVLRKPHGDGA